MRGDPGDDADGGEDGDGPGCGDDGAGADGNGDPGDDGVNGNPGDEGAAGDVAGGLDTPAGPLGARGRSGVCSAASVSCTVQDRCSPVSTSKKPVRS